MSHKPKNKKVAALLAGASLLTIVAGGRANAGSGTQIISTPPFFNTVVISGNPDRVIVDPTANITGDVINQTVIGDGNDPNPVAI